MTCNRVHRGGRIAAERVQSSRQPLVIGRDDSVSDGSRVELVREESSLVEIHVYCRCGERTVIHCDTGTGAAQQTATGPAPAAAPHQS